MGKYFKQKLYYKTREAALYAARELEGGFWFEVRVYRIQERSHRWYGYWKVEVIR